MKSQVSMRAAIAAALLAGMSVAAAAPAAAVCKPKAISDFSKGRFETFTALSARQGWRRKVRARFGYKWAYWSKASESSTKCTKEKDGRWLCVARAKPCF